MNPEKHQENVSTATIFDIFRLETKNSLINNPSHRECFIRRIINLKVYVKTEYFTFLRVI